MNTFIKKEKTRNIITILMLMIIVGTYIALFAFRYIGITSNAGGDSTLQVKLAMYLSSHQWLGKYDEVTLSKGLSFPLLLALFNKLRLPFGIGICLFNIICTYIFLLVVIPFFKHRRIMIVLFSFAFLFNPLFMTATQALPYRDTTAYGTLLLIFCWSIGIVLNFTVKLNKVSLISSFIGGILGLPYWQNLREDSSWAYPFIIVSSIVVLIYVYKFKRSQLRLLCMVILTPVLCLLAMNCFIGYKNYINYGRFIVNEYRSSDFKSAMGTMSAVKNNEWVINVPVNTKARNDMYKSVPEFRKLRKYLDTNEPGNFQSLKYVGVKEPSFGNDYQGGWFPWAYRMSVYSAGYAHTPTEFKHFNEKLSQEIVIASKKGKLDGPKRVRKSLVAPFDKRIVKPVFKESFIAFKSFLCMDDIRSDISIEKENDKSMQNKMAIFLKSKYPKKSTNGIFNHKAIVTYKNIYMSIEFVSFFILIIDCLRLLIIQQKNGLKWTSFNWLVLIDLGLILQIILRVVMLAYVTVTSFPAIFSQYLSSTYSLYLASIVMLTLTVDYKLNSKGK